eukprot:SAG22_NODE_1784_length_3588_cov_27.751791_4_plen_63_part_00
MQRSNLDPGLFMPCMDELGASSVNDLAFVEPADVRALELKPIPRNKLLAALLAFTGSNKTEL